MPAVKERSARDGLPLVSALSGPLGPDEALSELRSLQRARAAESQASVATSLPAAASAMPASATPHGSPHPSPPALPPRPALAVGPPLAGMPESIVVGRTYAAGCTTPARDIATVQVRFVDYVRNVLPNEWVASWPPAALDAGAVAAKQFAGYTTVIQRKWRNQGYPFDVIDNTCDQYYRDGSADPRTDAAIQRTWGTLLTRNLVLLRTYFRDTEGSCGGMPDCMGQVESAVLASAGQSSLQILARYYNTPGTSVLVTGARLPAHLPPVPPVPPILLLPAPTLTAVRPTLTPIPVSPVVTATTTVAVVPVEESAAPTVRGTPQQATPTVLPTRMPPTPLPLPLVIPTAVPLVTVPNLAGLGENQAKAALAQLGIANVVVDYQGRDRLGDLYDRFPAYAVVSHIPPAGAPARPETPVVLGVRAP